MAFETFSKGSGEGNVDFEAYNKYMVETCNLEEPEPVVGVISGLISLGTQVPKPSEYLKAEGEDEAAEVAKNPNVVYEDRAKFYHNDQWLTDVRVKIVPNKPQQLVAITVDFPDIIVDKGQFFGESNPAPLRMLLGGEFHENGETVVAKPLTLKTTKNEKTNNKWTIAFTNTLYKMAVAARIVKQGDPFLPEMVDQLLGKALQFKVQVKLNDAGYLVEKCSFAAALGRGQSVPDMDQNLLYIIQYTSENDEKAVSNLRKSIRNTIKKAEQYEGSVLQKQIVACEVNKSSSSKKDSPEKPAQRANDSQSQDDSGGDDFNFDEDDIPF